MTLDLTSIIIPTYNHARFVGAAIDSALAQTAPVEVLVVDDGSTDETPAVLAGYGDRVRSFHLEHAGPSAARNLGLREARGTFVMLLDADDVIHPDKVAHQLAEMRPEIGWVLCDVRIEDEAKGRTILASKQYGYAGRHLNGWIRPQLEAANFIPIMSPLVRTSVLSDVRFGSAVPEDWFFWREVASRARVAYVPEVLATYRHRKTGRSRTPMPARRVLPAAALEQPLRLNLGCGTEGKPSWHPLPGMVNLDKSLGWRFEDGLDFPDGSVSGITISHSLYLVPLERWPAIFSELARVLAPGGVLRITEDDAVNPRSSRRGGWRGSESAVTITSAAMVLEHMARAGLAHREVDAVTTGYTDRSLLQAWHGDPPDVFFVEGVRMQGVLFSPHNDDEALFASYTILRHRPHVVVCFPSAGDYGAPERREAESRAALSVLGACGFEQWKGGGLDELLTAMRDLDARVHPARAWAPDEDASHPDHLAVAMAAAEVFGDRLTTYHTYNFMRAGTWFTGPAVGKVRSPREVPREPEWVQAKLRALARYESQAQHPRACMFFEWDLAEYYGRGPQ